MTKKQIKAFLYQLASFVILFVPLRIVLGNYTSLIGFWVQIVALVLATVLAPKFQAIKTKDGEKLFMKVLFIKEVKEIS